MTKKEASITKQTFRIWYQVSKNYSVNFSLSFLNPIGTIFSNVLVPFFGSRAIAVVGKDYVSFKSYLFKLIISVFIAVIFNRIGFINLMKLQAKCMNDLNYLVFEKLMKRGAQFHINNIGGKIVSDSMDFLSSYGNLLNMLFTNAASFTITLVLGLILISLSSWQLGLYVFSTVFLVAVWTFFDAKRRSSLRIKRHVALKKIIGHFSDSVVNAQTVKTFGAEEFELDRQKQLGQKLSALRIHDWVTAGKNGNNRSAVMLCSIVVLLIIINYLNAHGYEVLGAGIFAYTFTFTMILRLFEVNSISRMIEESLLSSRNTTAMLLESLEIEDKTNAVELKIERGEINFENVNFGYQNDNKNDSVFENFNLKIKKAEKIGLIGPSGGGKTTLTRLLLRFEELNSGRILIDDQNIAEVTQVSLRKNIGYVPQEPLLFHRSIFENIAYGKPNALLPEVQAAAKSAQADLFISKLSHGYDTIVGERGVKLSGGQRQRVAIARAILKNAPILILDEATSALDSESEKYVQAALANLMQGKTTVVIAHRLSTIAQMDRIIVLDNGKIVEQGSHQELLKQKGLYSVLWGHQSGGFIQE